MIAYSIIHVLFLIGVLMDRHIKSQTETHGTNAAWHS